MLSISGRDKVPLGTGRKIESSRISLVSFNTSCVAATSAALRAVAAATGVCAGR